jgi:hypothetical protein
LRKGIISVLLYLLTISITIIIASEGIVIFGIFNLVAFGIIFSIAFFLNNLTLNNNPSLHDSFNNPDNIIHIIAPICYLVLTFIPQIVWFFWPAVGEILISTSWSTFGILVIVVMGFALGGICSYLRLESSLDKIPTEE